MKPLPLLLTLSAVAFLGAGFLILRKPVSQSANPSENPQALTPIPQAPLPSEEEPPPLPQPPLLENDLIPDPQLITFVEKHLGLTFEETPIFNPTPAEEVITTIERGITAYLPTKERNDLDTAFQRLGALHPFQQIDQSAVTILAAETRGLITPTRNLILNDFENSSPPEQAALVNLLAQRLLSEKIPFSSSHANLDQILARHFMVQNLALRTEKEFRKTLPSYPPSLNENLRESILLGLPAFFHELATFSEFHLLSKLQTSAPPQAVETFAVALKESPTPSRDLLAFPFTPESSSEKTQLGAIPLYLFLLQATDPTTARTLATSLMGDHLQLADNSLRWTLVFESKSNPPRAAEFFRSYFSLRDADRKIRIEVEGKKLIIAAAP